ncbi:type IV pilus biogenesis protein PilM [Thermostichus vulcanus]|uniref:type IV pilus biogenesis protein PilM n=1 Tax=Thermostichus vulcanus TaxID=32053 RepID=UPI001FCAA46D|nr:type IV pilus assembly protein PilM [Thermostichus vulcanus]
MRLAVAQRAVFPGVFSFLGGSKTQTMLGVDINPERISVAQLKKQGNGRYRLAHYHSVEMPEGAMIEGRILDPGTIGLALMNLLNENKIPTNLPTATAVPVREAIVRLIRLPADLPADELRRVVLEQEAELYIPYPRDQADVDYQPLGLDLSQDGIERIEVLLVAIPKEVVDNYLEVLQAANLKVRCVELASFSLIRTIREQLTQYGPQEAVLLSSIGYESSEISILVNGIPQFTRTVNIGTIHMRQVLAQSLNLPISRTGDLLQSLKLPLISPTDVLSTGEQPITTNPGVAAVTRVISDLADEIKRSIDFFINTESSAPVVKVLLAGPGASIGQMDGFLSQSLSMAVELADPFGNIAVPDSLELPLEERPAMGVALGLALREYTK